MSDNPIVDQLNNLSDRDLVDVAEKASKVVTGLIDISQFPEGLRILIDGYIEFGEEVIINRALPAMDGLKPVSRRLLETFRTSKDKNIYRKSGAVVGATSALHPHGDSSIYEALVNATDKKGAMFIPLVDGWGSFGQTYHKGGAAAMRYTECKVHANAEHYFKEMDGINWVPAETEGVEPDLLPVDFPSILCNSTSGIAIGFSCNFPSFNLNDVVDLTCEYLKKGEMTTVIAPDFVGGGYYIKNNKELAKLMTVGKASLKLRGRVEIDGKKINVVEFPEGVTIDSVMKQLDNKNIDGVKKYNDYSDKDRGALLCIECRSKNVVENVLLQLYKETDIQTSFAANMVGVVNGAPKLYGVYDWIKEWVKWRMEVLKKQYEHDIKALNARLPLPRAMLTVVDDEEARDTVLYMLGHNSDAETGKYLVDRFGSEIMTPDAISFILDRKARTFKNGGRYRNEYEGIVSEVEMLQGYLKDLKSVIYNQLQEIKKTLGTSLTRRTQITSTDYDFTLMEERENEVVKDYNEYTYVYRDGFLRKLRYYTPDDRDEVVLTGYGCDVIIGIDNLGQVIRVYCEHLPVDSSSDLGTYLPKYLGMDEVEGYDILWLDKFDATQEKMLIYNDGYVGFLDESEWSEVSRQVRVVKRGVSPEVENKLLYVCDIPEYLAVFDSDWRFSFTHMGQVKHKHRTARTSVFNIKKGNYITYVGLLNQQQALTVVKNSSNFTAPRMRNLERSEDFTGSLADFLRFA